MKKFYLAHSTIIAAYLFILLNFSCSERPFIPDYTNAGGYVVSAETCKTNPADEYWLVDLTYDANTPQYGDTLTVNGIHYRNLVKVKTLDPRLKQSGMTVSFDFKTVTADKIITTGCTLTNPVIYPLKELFIINQFEIR